MKYACLIIMMAAIGIVITGIMENTSADNHTTGSAYLWFSPHIAANVNLGDPIDVCSNNYPKSTEAAVRLWNDSLSSYLDHDVFKWQKSFSFCSASSNSRDRIDYVIVKYFDPDRLGMTDAEKAEGCPNTAAHGCIREYPRNDGTFIGRMKLIIQFSGHKPAVDASKPFTLVRDIAHEMGHVLGLRDYHCEGSDPDWHKPGVTVLPASDSNSRSLMNNTTAIAACNITRLALTPRDIQDFKNAYPSPWRAPTPTPASTEASTAVTATTTGPSTATTTTATEEPTDTSTTTTATEEPTDTSTTTTATEEPTDTSTTTTATEEPTDTPATKTATATATATATPAATATPTATATATPATTPTDTPTAPPVVATPVRYCTLLVLVGSGSGIVGGTTTVRCGTTVAASAVASRGWCFSGWTPSFGVSGATACPRTNIARIRLTVSLTLRATFTRAPTPPPPIFRPTGTGEEATPTPTPTTTSAPTATATPTAIPTPPPSATSTPAATPPPSGPSGQ